MAWARSPRSVYNLATVRIGMGVGLKEVANTLQNLGVSRDVDLLPSLLFRLNIFLFTLNNNFFFQKTGNLAVMRVILQ